MAEPSDGPSLAAVGAAFALGVALALQVGVNGQLMKPLGNPLLGALVSFLVGGAALLVVCLIQRPPMPTVETLRATPLWVWSGGLLGAGYVAGAILLKQRLGTAVLLGLVVSGQLTAALVLDHFGWVGTERVPATGSRIVGVGLLIAGCALLVRK